MTTRSNRLVAFVTLCVMLLFAAFPALASEEPVLDDAQIVAFTSDDTAPPSVEAFAFGDIPITPFWTNIAGCSTNLTIFSDGSYSATATCTAQAASYSITIKLELQKAPTWNTIRTINGSGKGVADAYGTGTVDKGTYRTKATITVNGEQAIVYSKEKTRP